MSGLRGPDIFAICQNNRAIFYPDSLEIFQFERVSSPDNLSICSFIRDFLTLLFLRFYELSGLQTPAILMIF